MKKIIIILATIIVVGLSSKTSLAQQDAIYSQYNFNMQTINSAYAGTWENLGFLALGRQQWAGINGAPSTYLLSVQAPIKNKNMGVGINIISDKIGKESRLMISGDYSYKIKITDNVNLRFGIKLNLTNYSNILTDCIQYPEGEQDVFPKNINTTFLPNIGTGLFLSSEKYYVGLSLPKLFQTELSSDYSSFYTYSEFRHYYLTAGYIFDINNNIKFTPTTILKAVSGSPMQADFTGSFILNERVWFGATYRLGNSFGIITQFIISKHTRIGYAVDFYANQISSSGSHEIMLSYELGSLMLQKTRLY